MRRRARAWAIFCAVVLVPGVGWLSVLPASALGTAVCTATMPAVPANTPLRPVNVATDWSTTGPLYPPDVVDAGWAGTWLVTNPIDFLATTVDTYWTWFTIPSGTAACSGVGSVSPEVDFTVPAASGEWVWTVSLACGCGPVGDTVSATAGELTPLYTSAQWYAQGEFDGERAYAPSSGSGHFYPAPGGVGLYDNPTDWNYSAGYEAGDDGTSSYVLASSDAADPVAEAFGSGRDELLGYVITGVAFVFIALMPGLGVLVLVRYTRRAGGAS
jgi:hypothetical protein